MKTSLTGFEIKVDEKQNVSKRQACFGNVSEPNTAQMIPALTNTIETQLTGHILQGDLIENVSLRQWLKRWCPEVDLTRSSIRKNVEM